MKKNRFLVLVGLAVASFVLLTGFRHAGGPHGHGGPDMEKRVERILTEIDATPQQREQIKAITGRLAEQKKARRAERREDKKELVEFWKQANPDPSQIRAKIDEKVEAHRQSAYEMADAMIEIHRILTPEQRAEVAQLMEKKMERHGKRMDERRGQAGPQAQPEAR